MSRTRRALFVIFACMAAVPMSGARAQEAVKVTATFSILGDLVRNVGGDRIALTTLVGPNGDAHVYSPSPADAKALVEARLVIANGLGFEGWITRLVKASGTKAPIVMASSGIKPRKQANAGHAGHGDVDPHAWQSVANAKIYVANIRDALIKADAAGEPAYRANASRYLERLDQLDREIREALNKLPAERRKVITTHDAFGYFADAYSVAFIAPQGVSTESEASARDVARIITQVRKQQVPAVFLENVTDSRLIKRIADETGARIGGTLYSDALTDDKGPASTYIGMMRHNVKTLSVALEPGS